MTARWGLGPVFANEWLTTCRRWQVYAGRALFVGVLLAGLSSVWVSEAWGRTSLTIQAVAGVGLGFYRAIVATQLTLVILAAPAATAGAICQDRSSGKLRQLLATDLTDSEIMLGKLAARLVPVLGLVCCALPVLSMSSLLGGIDPLALAGTFLITLCLAVFGCTLALAFSVWASKPYEVLLATYAVFGVWLLVIPAWDLLARLWGFPSSPDWTIWSHPFYLAVAPYVRPDTVGVADYLMFAAVVLGVSAVLLVVAIGRMRAVTAGEEAHETSRPRERRVLGVSIRSRGTGAARSALEANPLLWYEIHRKEHTPWVRTLIELYFLLAIIFSLLAVIDNLWIGWRNRGWLAAHVVAFQVVIGLPVLLLASVTALVEERARGSLDVLLATPLSTRSIVLAKWWGAFRELPRLLALPVGVAAMTAWQNNTWPLLGMLFLFIISAAAFWTSVGLALSTWVSRLGRAISSAVILYALIALGWPMLSRTLFGRPVGAGLSAISPFYGLFDLTYALYDPRSTADCRVWFPCWIVVQAVMSAGLLLATLATFDRCLGRIR
jgi:ABC-type transport system involved in multi-copper enzyme maturation permease subunit